MDFGNWLHVASLETEAEREEYQRWTVDATIEQAEMRGYGMSSMVIKEVFQDWFGKVRVVFVKNNLKGSTGSYKNGQIFGICSSVGNQTRQKCFADTIMVSRGVVISSDMNGVVALALDEMDFDCLVDFLEKSDKDFQPCEGTMWELCLAGSEMSSNLRTRVLKEYRDKRGSPDQSAMKQKLANAIRVPQYKAVDPRLMLFDQFETSEAAIHISSTFRQSHPFLNEPQLRSVANSLSKPVSCIHGPPGTGKTTTVAELIIELHSQHQRVLIAGPSNISVDNVLSLCVKNEDVSKACVRLGHPARQKDELHQYSFDQIVRHGDLAKSCQEIKTEIGQAIGIRSTGSLKNLSPGDLRTRLREALPEDASRKQIRAAAKCELAYLRRELRIREANTSFDVFSAHPLVFCTCAGAMMRSLQDYVRSQDRYYDYVVIDEAAKATVLESLMAVQLGKRVVLAGDHKQLRATVKSKEAEKIGLGISLMERLISENIPSTMLRVQYRMNTDLMDWSSSQFYGARLQADVAVADRRLDLNVPGLYWLDTADCSYEIFKESSGERDFVRNPSKFNVAEAIVVKAYIANLLKKYSDIKSIGVISFYARQVKLLDQYLRIQQFENLGSTDISVGTVDGFQGKEADVIILSMVRSNKSGEIGFLSEATRINVSVTRAQRHCAIVGDSRTVARKDELLKSLFEACTVETCLTQIDLDDLANEKSVLTRKFLQDDLKAADERPTEASARARQRFPMNRFKRKSTAKDAEYRKTVKGQLKSVQSGATDAITFDRLTAYERMVVHTLAGELGLEHISVGERTDIKLIVRRPAREDVTIASKSVRSSLSSLLGFSDASSGQFGGRGNDFHLLVNTTSSEESISHQDDPWI